LPPAAPRLAVLWLAGVDLRLTVLAVPPVLPLIHQELGLSEKAVGALSGLPLLVFGLAAVAGSLLIARIGARRACLAGLLIAAAAGAGRGAAPTTPMLFAATLAMAIGIAVVQPTLPSLVGEWFPRRAAFATAVYANGLLLGEALPAALTIPLVLPLVGGSWRASFVLWSLPLAATALLLALPAIRGPAAGEARSVRPQWWPDWRDPHTWQLGLMQGGTGGLYFASNAFIPDYLHAVGRPELVGLCLGALNAGQMPASVAMLLWPRRLGGGKRALLAMPIVALLGVAAFLGAEPWTATIGAGVVGFCGAVMLTLTFALPPQIAPHRDVHRLSAGMFTIGYLVACAIPLLGGAIWDATGRPATAFLAPALSTALILGATLTLRLPTRLAGG
jgi:CP family cyanate transporter-like MFS transporter